MNIFISHSHADNEICSYLSKKLTEYGFTIWLDQSNLKPGKISPAIDEALSKSTVLLLVLSPDALSSQWVREEFDAFRALMHEDPTRTIIPVTTQPISPSLIWPLLKDYQRIEAPLGLPLPKDDMANTIKQRVELFASQRVANAHISNSSRHRKKASVSKEYTFEQAQNFFRRGKLDEGRRVLEKVLALPARSYSSWFYVGYCLSIMGRDDDTKVAFNKALSLFPADGNSYQKSLIFSVLGRPQEALAIIEGALVIEPNNAGGLTLKGMSLFELGKYTDAWQSLQAALNIDAEVEPAQELAVRTLIRLEDYKKGLQVVDHALSFFPKSATLLEHKGQILLGLSRIPEALNAYDRSISIDPNNVKSWMGKAIALERSEKDEEAIYALERGISLIKSRDSFYYDAMCFKSMLLVLEERYEEALVISTDLWKRCPSDYNYLIQHAHVLYKLERLQESVQVLWKVTEIAPADTSAWVMLSELYSVLIKEANRKSRTSTTHGSKRPEGGSNMLQIFKSLFKV